MATSGQLKTNTTYDSYFWVKWEQNGNQDIANNRTPILWSCGVYCGHNFYSNAIKMSPVSINGSQVYGGGTYSNFYEGKHTIASGSMRITHDSNGKKSFKISSFTGWLYKENNYSSGGETFSLEPIPRQALITSVSDFTDEDNPSFTFSNPGGFPMDVWLEPNPVGDHLCIKKNIPNIGTYKWELTDAEREALRNKCVGQKCTIRVGLYTNVNGTIYADYKDKTFYMTENEATKPVVSLGVVLNNGSLPSKFAGMYIQGKSRLDVSISAQGKYSANIISYSASVDGKTYTSTPFTSNVLGKDGKVEVIGYAKDSRQFTGSAKQEINVTAYSKPLVISLGSETAIQCYRSDGNGNRIGNSTSVWIKAKRSYYSLSGKNQCALQWRRKLISDAWDDKTHQWTDLIPKTNTTTNEYNALLSGVVFDLTKSYSVQIKAIDDIGEYDLKNFEIPTQDVALHLGKGGKNVSVGTYCDYSKEYTFYSDWDAYFDKDVFIEGTQVSNHVVDEGTKDSWKYRKWKDGTAELWGAIRATHANGSILEGGLDFPFVLTGTVYGIGTLNSAGGNGVGALPWNLKLTYDLDHCDVWVHNPGSVNFTTSSTADVSVYIVGKWK